MRAKTIGFKRVKGHGSRMTLLLVAPLSNTTLHIKLRPAKLRKSLKDEAAKLRWAQGVLPVTSKAIYVPTLPIAGLITNTIAGQPAHKLIGTVPPKQIIAGLMDAIALLQAVPSSDIPFDPPEWASNKNTSLRNLADLKNSRKRGKTLHPDFEHLSRTKLKEIIMTGSDKPSLRVLSHGDICMPNLLFDDNVRLSGIVDLGAMHVNDPLLDIALMSWCLKANMGSKWSNYLLQNYGLDENNPQIQYYRLAYDLSLDFPNAWDWVSAPKLARQRAELEQAL